jgi:ABC-type bacteriocin/lantibiotic exporter with double-glycine peptidase domain
MTDFVKDFKFIHQYDDYSCGFVAFKMILRAFAVEHPLPDKTLKEMLGTSPESGTYQASLVRMFKFFKFKVKESSFANRRPSLRNVKFRLSKGFLGICAVDDNEHWTILRGMSGSVVYIADPDPNAPQRQLWRTFLRRLSKGSIVWVKK